LLDMVVVLTRPQPDAALIEDAGINLDRALFPLLLRIDKLGPIGIVEIAELVGRDHTTVSRQVSKLESLGLVVRVPGPKDKRVKATIVTDEGAVMTRALDDARQRLYEKLLSDWSEEEIHMFARLLRRAADRAMGWAKGLENP
jgi:DNA-binding MarR family transcriptional regulator